VDLGADLTISRRDARRFLLDHQGLLPPRSLSGQSGVLAFLRRVRCIQFDPLDVVGRNPELVLQARVSDFRRAMLEHLVYGRRALVDGWDKQMSLWLVEDWPGFRRERESALEGHGGRSSATSAAVARVRAAIRERGPLSSIDVLQDGKVDWPWGPARVSRAAMESMWWWGELVVCRRVHTRKVYDFAERRIPRRHLDAPDPHATEEEHLEWRVLRRLRGVGLLWERSSDAWLGIPGVKSRERAAILGRLRARREVLAVGVEGIDRLLFVARDDAAILQGAGPVREAGKPEAAILGPLDNLLWDRGLVRALFDFDYVWEVYKPESERRFGYYVLPILCGDRFVARFEPARANGSGALVVRRWWWEAGVSQTVRLRAALRRCFRQFREYLGAEELQLSSEVARDLEWLR
jgi:uncharacterized protein